MKLEQDEEEEGRRRRGRRRGRGTAFSTVMHFRGTHSLYLHGKNDGYNT